MAYTSALSIIQLDRPDSSYGTQKRFLSNKKVISFLYNLDLNGIRTHNFGISSPVLYHCTLGYEYFVDLLDGKAYTIGTKLCKRMKPNVWN